MADDSEDPVKNPIEKVAEELRAEYEASWEATFALHPEMEQRLTNFKEKLDEEQRRLANRSQEEILASGSREAVQKDFDRIMAIAIEGYMAIAMLDLPPEKDTKITASDD